jgi:thioredoxin-related protein
MALFLCLVLSVGSAASLSAEVGEAGEADPGDFADRVTVYGFEEAVREAKKENKHVLVYFWAPDCVYCREFSETTLNDEDVLFSLQDFATVSCDINQNRRLAKRFRVVGVPNFVFLNGQGRTVSQIPGFVTSDFFLVYLEYVKTMAYTNINFSEYVESLAAKAPSADLELQKGNL